MLKLPLILFCLGMFSFSQSPEKKQAEDLILRVGVEEVRVDAVVVDGKGRQVTDLTADDFEVYQDGLSSITPKRTYLNICRK